MKRFSDYLVRTVALFAAISITAGLIFVHAAPLERLGAPAYASNAPSQVAVRANSADSRG